MAVLGLLLVLAAGALTADVVIQNSGRMTEATVANTTVTDLTLSGVFVAGAVAGLLFALGLALLFGGAGRARRRRATRRAAAAEERDRAESLRVENERLEQRLAEERAARADAESTTGVGAADVYPTDTYADTAQDTEVRGGRHAL